MIATNIPTNILVLLYLFVIASRVPRLRERWSAPLLRGPEFFFGAAVSPGFMAGPGRGLLRTYRLRLGIPWLLEIASLIPILLYANRIFVLILISVIAWVTRLNFYAARQAAETAARTLEPALTSTGITYTVSLHSRRLADYTYTSLEAVIIGLTAASLLWRLYLWRTGQDHPHAAVQLLAALVTIYLQTGLVFLKRAIVRARDVLPAEHADQYSLWRESFRRLSTRQCDLARVVIALSLPLVDLVPFALRTHGRASFVVLGVFWLALGLLGTWYEVHIRNQYLAVARQTRPAILISRPDTPDAAGLIRFLPSHPVFLLGTPTGYAINLAGAPARIAGAYLAGFAGLCLWLVRLLPVLLCLVAFSTARAQTTPPTLTGEWDGVLAGKLHVIVRVEPAPGAALHATLESPDQSSLKMDIDAFTYTAPRAVHFEIAKIGATFDGELAPTASEIAGTFQQGAQRLPLTLRRPGVAASTTLKPLTRGRVPLQPCFAADGTTEALCGTLPVFEDRTTASGRKLALNVMLLPSFAPTPAPDPVFVFAGGPGQSAVETYPFVPYIALLRKHHDIVLLDQRGTGRSNPLRCPVSPHDLQTLINGPTAVSDIPACRTALEKVADLTQYTTSNAADDADELRAALGYDHIDVLGGSYGTLASLVYLRRHQAHVRAVVLEGVAPPDYRMPLPFAKTIDAAVDHIFSDCAADPACNQAYPHLRQDFAALLERLNREPARFTLPDGPGATPQSLTLTRGGFVSDFRSMLYVPAFVSAFPALIEQAYQGDFTSFATVTIAMHRATSDLARGLSLSVNCSESVPFLTEPEIKAATGGTALGDYDVRIYQHNCSQWPHAAVSPDFLEPVQSDVPVLLLSGAEDPATPPSFAAHAARQLSHATVVALPKGTHLTDSVCIDGMIDRFLAAGTGTGLDTSCVQQLHNPAFVIAPEASKPGATGTSAQATGSTGKSNP